MKKFLTACILLFSYSLVLSQAAKLDKESLKLYWISNRIPAITSNNPSVFSSGYFRYMGLGMAVQHRTRVNLENTWRPDGNAAVYVGLANPKKLIGLGLTFNLFGLSNSAGEKGNFGEGSIDIHLSRAINDFIYLGGGLSNAIQWNTNYTNTIRSFYLSASGLIPFRQDNSKSFGFAYLTGGIGNGIYQKRKDWLAGKSNVINFFGSLAIQVLPETNLILEWTGTDFTIATSFFPFKKQPIHLIIGVADLNYKYQRFIGSISYSFFIQKKETHTKV